MKGRKLSYNERMELFHKNSNERVRVFKALCEHIENGYSVDCFPDIGEDSIKEYLKTYPEEFDEGRFIQAKRKGKIYWEDIGRRQADGKCMGNSRTWYYNMSNRFGWREKVDVEAEHKGNINVNVVSYATTKKPTA